MNNRFLSAAIALTLSATAITALAQEESDVLKYSQLSPQGTARSMGFGSALGSVGADFTSLSVNPGGIGMYRKGEMTFTPSVKVNSVTGSYLGNRSSDDVSQFNVNNFGLVFTSAPKGKRYEKSKWKSTSFGIGFNKLADYNRTYNYQGRNSGPNSSSVSELFAADANSGGDILNPDHYAYLGYKSYLINPDSVNGYYTVVPWQSGINQGRSVLEKGRYNEWAISLGGNYMEKLLIGATIGIPTVRYRREANVTESPIDANNPFDFQNLDLGEVLTTRGTGLNLKLGFIYKPTDQFRFGGAIHTPTWFNMTDDYSNTLSAVSQGYETSIAPTPFISNYSLTTPWRGVVSATGMIGKVGFITADYEYVGYNTGRYSVDDVNLERYLNKYTRTNYKGASNVRIGGEVRPAEMVSLRVGFGYYGSPYKNSAMKGERIDLSAGIGFRFQQMFLDFGFVNSSFETKEQPYVLPYNGVTVPTASLKHSMNNAALTIGFKF